MDKNLKQTIRLAKGLHKKGLIHLQDNIELTAEPNYQALALLIEKLNIIMDKGIYETIKEDKERLVYEIALSTYDEKQLISDLDIEFRKHIIKKYVDIDDPVLIGDEYCFVTKTNKLQDVYEKACRQIGEGKFKNVIF